MANSGLEGSLQTSINLDKYVSSLGMRQALNNDIYAVKKGNIAIAPENYLSDLMNCCAQIELYSQTYIYKFLLYR